MFPPSFYPSPFYPRGFFPPRPVVGTGPGPGPFRAITASVAVARGMALASRAAPRGPAPVRSGSRPYGG
jgi:hypothetical protein